jgi:hypothetical protein
MSAFLERQETPPGSALTCAVAARRRGALRPPRRSMSPAYSGQFADDAAVTPLWVLVRQPAHQGGGSLAIPGRPGRPGHRKRVWRRRRDSAKQRRRLDKEAPETPAGGSPASPASTARSAGCSGGRCTWRPRTTHLVTQDRDLDREIRISETGEENQLEHAGVRPVEALASVQVLAASGHSRQSAVRGRWMAVSAPTGLRCPSSAGVGGDQGCAEPHGAAT